MTTKKITLKEVKENEVLSKQEMKNVMAGSGGDCGHNTCSDSRPCCYPQVDYCVNGYCQSRG